MIEATVEAWSRSAPRARIAAGLGPCIAQGSYESAPNSSRASPRDPDWRSFAQRQPGRSMFDFHGYIVEAGRAAPGSAAFEDSGLDTYADEARFFSYRRMTHRSEADYGGWWPPSCWHKGGSGGLPPRSVELGELRVRQLLHPPPPHFPRDARPGGAGDRQHHRAALQQPGERDLAGRRLVGRAMRSSAPPGLGRSPAASGYQGMKPMPCFSQ